MNNKNYENILPEIPFNKPSIVGSEIEYIVDAAQNGQLSGDGNYTRKAKEVLDLTFKPYSSLLTHSCTAALELVALLLDIKPGDEIICPSYTFVSTVNAFVLRGARIRFCDIDSKSLCIDLECARKLINTKTKAIIAVHYAGISCDMAELVDICTTHSIYLIEDAAQAYMSKFNNQLLGTFGDFATFSFHETKNLICGEGGAILIKDKSFFMRAEIIREKGTNRSQYFRGEVSKYTWVDIGSSYLPGELVAAFLYGQLEKSEHIFKKRRILWSNYYSIFKEFSGIPIKIPFIPSYNDHNGHMFYLICSDNTTRTLLIQYLKEHRINAVFHYIPLHSSPASLQFGFYEEDLDVTSNISETIVRLPLHLDLTFEEQSRIADTVYNYFKNSSI